VTAPLSASVLAAVAAAAVADAADSAFQVPNLHAACAPFPRVSVSRAPRSADEGTPSSHTQAARRVRCTNITRQLPEDFIPFLRNSVGHSL